MFVLLLLVVGLVELVLVVVVVLITVVSTLLPFEGINKLLHLKFADEISFVIVPVIGKFNDELLKLFD
uniref:Uncharacterized protein n=1 Tax=Schistosoma curassoni TaxID=6186 RepID=A0A183L5K1_9TREM